MHYNALTASWFSNLKVPLILSLDNICMKYLIFSFHVKFVLVNDSITKYSTINKQRRYK